MHIVCKSRFLESSFLSTCDCILTLHSVCIKLYTSFVVSNDLHLLVRDVSNRWQRYEKVFVPLLQIE